MGTQVWIALALVFTGGIAVATQAPLNAALSRALNGNVTAAAISFLVGFLALGVVALAREGFPAMSAVRTVPWWAWCGGFFGGYYVWTAVSAVPVLGVVTMIAALILGQLVAALILDAIGAFGMPVREIGWTRILAVVLVAAGLVLSRI